MSRKTISIVDLVIHANDLFLQSHDDCIAEREGVQLFVANILHKTGNYKGYRYLTPQDMANSGQGTTYGVTFHPDNKPVLHDKSRVEFYVPRRAK